MKKVLKAILVTVVCLTIFAATGLYILDSIFSDMCGNEVYKEVFSPDKRMKVVVFQRDCGATTGFSTQISLIPADEDLQNEGGNLLVADGHPDDFDIKVDWLDSQRIRIGSLSSLQPHWYEETVEGVTVIYE